MSNWLDDDTTRAITSRKATKHIIDRSRILALIIDQYLVSDYYSLTITKMKGILLFQLYLVFILTFSMKTICIKGGISTEVKSRVHALRLQLQGLI
jgi:hypothetical protein